ncbi:DNA mismatch repair protein MutT [Luteimicrobium album]|uniref:DNA mismatch repair protein MutT n=1 Tax=Luteimicrobium album TaxID=1054550 RepID=A0ABQ6I2A2_9MICO|nr:NUDIX domain-containing protein [Luteimicrobium album]GMA24362.1 DNA mismatch repair protein MutT [Luteimicrobium album]
MAVTEAAGLVLWRRGAAGVEVLVGHMGGPFWSRKDARAWTIPKGEVEVLPADDDAPARKETLYDAALRETAEELGVQPPSATGPDGAPEPDVPLGTVRNKSGKRVTAWARRVPDGWDLPDPGRPASNTFTLEWPPRSGRTQEFPELDRTRWCPLDDARALVIAAQEELLTRLDTHLEG